MKKTYKIEVDCANCANLMEEAARKTAAELGQTLREGVYMFFPGPQYETPAEVLAAIEAVLMQQTFQATGYGVGGTFSKEFYCSAFAPKAAVITDGHEVWEGASFTIIEV